MQGTPSQDMRGVPNTHTSKHKQCTRVYFSQYGWPCLYGIWSTADRCSALRLPSSPHTLFLFSYSSTPSHPSLKLLLHILTPSLFPSATPHTLTLFPSATPPHPHTLPFSYSSTSSHPHTLPCSYYTCSSHPRTVTGLHPLTPSTPSPCPSSHTRHR